MKSLTKKINIAGIVLLMMPVFAQADAKQVIPATGQPINITSDSLIIKNNENLSIFEKNAHVIQGEMNLYSDQLRLYTEDNKEKSKGDSEPKKSTFKTMEAEGHVYFKAPNKSATSDLAVYNVETGVLVLTNNVKIKDADTSMAGEVFIYNVITGVSEIRSSKDVPGSTNISTGRVRAVFTPGEKSASLKIVPMGIFEDIKTKVTQPSSAKSKDEK